LAQKAVIARRGARGVEAFALESRDAAGAGLKVERELWQGTLVSGDEKRLAALEKRGYRVKLLPDTNLLRIGAYRIDIGRRGPKVPRALDVPRRAVKTWPHHLVQLVAPAQPEWLREIEGTGADVVEPVSGYGLFVAATAREIAAVAKLPFAAWTGLFLPAYRLGPRVGRLKGRVECLSVAVYPPAAADSVRSALARRRAEVMQEFRTATPYGREFHVMRVAIDARHIQAIASLPRVRWVEYEPPLAPAGERETQIVAENLDATPPPNTSPVSGYQAWLAGAGLSGHGVTIAFADTGVDQNAGNNVGGHLDLRGRQAVFVDYTAGAVTTDTDGHGTNVAGIALGNAATGQREAVAPNDFLWGQGIAPQSSYVTQNFIMAPPPGPAVATVIQDSVNHGAQVMNNSWGRRASGGSGYVADSRTIDLAVRDPNSGTAGLEYLVLSCAAGNEGGADRTIVAPHESKNDIVVGNSLTSRPVARFPSRDIRGIFGTSSRGPAVDGRILPTVVAPGTDVSSALSRTSARLPIAGTGTPDPANPGQLVNRYLFMSGTSHSTAHVSGACALLIEWWRQRTGGRNPSPALLKAWLVNSAEDLAGGENWRCLNRTTPDRARWTQQGGSIFRRDVSFVPAAVIEDSALLAQVGTLAAISAAGQWFFDAGANRLFVRMLGNTDPAAPASPALHARDANPVPSIPNDHQGWGRVSLENALFQAPTSDRGPRIFSDQRHAFTANGQEYVIRVAAADASRPLRVTLVWTDAAAAVGANPTRVNDLDLEVTETATGALFKGNVFNSGFSAAGGNFDRLNNVECVYVRNPNGPYEIRVLASYVTASARPDVVTPWQDFALVVENARVPSASPVSVVPVIDRSGSMIAYGYEAVTRISSKQFVDLMGVDDQLAVVSFGSTGVIEYPPGAGPALQTITGPPTQAAADAEIDGMNFGGCTYMGDGIVKGRDLLAPAVNTRAMVLLSDGFDNKGCQPNNAARPSAMDVVATLPANLPVYTCAMGPTSDQSLLDQIASATGGRYYYMPTIDDLFEIYNYIRGQVSGDAIVANESAGASNSRVEAFVDAGASRATFSVAWANTALRFVAGEPRRPSEIGIRLRDPQGRLLPEDDSYVRRTVGVGYAIFAIQEPRPGAWFVEVRTAGETHVRYTVGGFVRSPIRMVVSVGPKVPTAGIPLTVRVGVLDGKNAVSGFRTTALVAAPSLGLKALQEKLKSQLADTRPGPVPGGDDMPMDIRKLLALRNRLLARTGKDVFATVSGPLTFTAGAVSSGQFAATQQQGSYNLAVVATGNAPVSGGRFVRKDQVSVLVR
jgi:Mg-chelatase subunit ChlD